MKAAVLYPSTPKPGVPGIPRYLRRPRFPWIHVAVSLLLVALAFGQRSQSDSDQPPVLRRRPPATESSDQDQSNSSSSQSSTEPNATPPQAEEPANNSQPEAQPHSSTASASEGRRTSSPKATTRLAYKFLRSRSGGVMRVTVADPDDTEGAAQISIHLRDAAAQCKRGDFTARLFTGEQNPPGSAVMRQLRGKIFYTAHGIDGGAELIISSFDPKAVAAIHQFLQFQAQQHRATMR